MIGGFAIHMGVVMDAYTELEASDGSSRLNKAFASHSRTTALGGSLPLAPQNNSNNSNNNTNKRKKERSAQHRVQTVTMASGHTRCLMMQPDMPIIIL